VKIDLKSTANFLDMLDVLSRERVVNMQALDWVAIMRLSGDGDLGETVMRYMRYARERPYVNGNSELAFFADTISCHKGCPLVLESVAAHEPFGSQRSVGHLHTLLAQSALCQLSLPGIRAMQVDDLLDARTALRDELLEFRAGILNLTHLLYRQVKGKNDVREIQQEAEVLVNTKIRAALMSLEHRMEQHKTKRIQRMLSGTGRVLVDACTWSLASLGKALLTLAGEIDSVKPPEDQIATYLYKLRRQLKS